MNTYYIILTIVWSIIGGIVFAKPKIDKVIYGLTWGMLMLQLILKCIE